MAKHLDTGKYGEQLAIDYLIKSGYTILAINWRYRYWEVDAIAKEGPILVFVEVKCRGNNRYGEPEEFVDVKKQKNLIQAAEAYLEQVQHVGEIRFDIVSVSLDTKEIKLIKDAFWSD